MEPAAHQKARILEYFHGPSGSRNYRELLAFAYKRVMRAKFIHVGASIQPPEHYVNEAIQRCLPGADGVIVRPLASTVALRPALCGIIKSILSHDAQPSEARANARGELQVGEEEVEKADVSVEDFETSYWSESAEDESVVRSSAFKRMDDRPVLEAFRQFIRSDEIVSRMVTLLLEEDIDEPATEVAKRIGISVAEVYVARKRLARLCSQFGEGGRN